MNNLEADELYDAYTGYTNLKNEAINAMRAGHTLDEWATITAKACRDSAIKGNCEDIVDEEELIEAFKKTMYRHADRIMRAGAAEEWVGWALGRPVLMEALVKPASGGFNEYELGEWVSCWIGSQGDTLEDMLKDYVSNYDLSTPIHNDITSDCHGRIREHADEPYAYPDINEATMYAYRIGGNK